MAEDSEDSLEDLEKKERRAELLEKQAAREAKAAEQRSQEAGKTFKGKAKSFFQGLSKEDSSSVFKKTLSTPLSPFTWLLKKIFFIFAILVGFFVAVLILLTLFNFLTGGGLSLTGTQLSILGSKVSGPLSTIITPVRSFVSDPVGTVAEFGTFKNPQTVEKKKPQGIEFKNFQTKRDIYRQSDQIEAVANVKIYALEKSDSEIEFSCLKSDITQSTKEATEIQVYGEEEGSRAVFIPANQEKTLSVQCKFDHVDLTTLIPDTSISKGKTISQKITLQANYKDFIVDTRLKVYTLDSKVLDNLEKEGTNPFRNFKINDPLVSSDRSVRSEQLKVSPVILSLNLLDAQPLREGPKYLLEIDLKPDKLNWNGKLSKLKGLGLLFPNGFTPSESGCPDFDRSSGNTLVLHNLALLEINKAKNIDNNQKFFCEFSVDSSAISEDLSFSLIQAEAKFDYIFEAYASATISKNLISSTTSS